MRAFFLPQVLFFYLAKKYITITCLSLVSLMLLMQVTELSYVMSFAGGANQSFSSCLRYVAWYVPHIIFDFGPFVLGLSIFMMGARLQKDNELTALYAACVSPVQLISGLMGLSVFLTVVLFLGAEIATPKATYEREQIFKINMPKKNDIWLKLDSYLVRAGFYDESQHALQQVVLYRFDKNRTPSLQLRIMADTLSLNAQGHLVLTHVKKEHLGSKPAFFEQQETLILEGVSLDFKFIELFKTPSRYDLLALKQIMTQKKELGYDVQSYAREYYQRCSFLPFSFLTCLVAFLLAFKNQRHIHFLTLITYGLVCMLGLLFVRNLLTYMLVSVV